MSFLPRRHSPIGLVFLPRWIPNAARKTYETTTTTMMMVVKKKKIKEENEDDEYVKSSNTSSTPLLLPRLANGRTSLCLLLWCCCFLVSARSSFFFNLTRTRANVNFSRRTRGNEDESFHQRDVCFSLSLGVPLGVGLSMRKKKSTHKKCIYSSGANNVFRALTTTLAKYRWSRWSSRE